MLLLRMLAAAPFLAVALTVPTPVSAGPAAAEPPAVEVPRTVDPTGNRDVTAELQREIDAVADGGTLRLRHEARYRVDGTLLLENRRGVTIDGNGAHLVATKRGAGDRTHLRIVGGSDLVVHDLAVTGANENAGLDDSAYLVPMVGQHGIRLEGVEGIELARVEVRKVFGDFVYVGPGPDGSWSDGVWIHDSTFERSGRQGITVTAGRHVVVERSSIAYSHRAIVDLEPNSASGGADDIHILDNTIGPSRLLFVAAAGRGPVDHVVIAGNKLHGHTMSVTVLAAGGDRREGLYVVGNTSDAEARRSPVHVTGVDGVVVTGNVQPITRAGEAMVAPTDSCGLLVTDNQVAPSTLQVSDHAVCGSAPPPVAPRAPAVAGRPESRAGRAPDTAAPTSSTSIAPPASGAGGAGTSWVRIAAAVVLALGAGAFVVRWALRADRRANRRRDDGSRESR